MVCALDDCYSLRNDPQLLYRRKQGNRKAWKLIPQSQEDCVLFIEVPVRARHGFIRLPFKRICR